MSFSSNVMDHKYAHTLSNGEKEDWRGISHRVASCVLGAVGADYRPVQEIITPKLFIPAGRYLSNAGRPVHQVQNCLLLRAGDSREEWGSLMNRVTTASMTGAGLGTVYSDLRERGALVRGMGGVSSGPTALMQMVNEAGRWIKQGGDRRVALWAGLHWNHPDVFEFIALKDWDEHTKARKLEDFSAPAPMDLTNISVILDDDFFAAYDRGDQHAHEIYWAVVRRMLETGEPGFSVDVGENAGEHLRNACCEVTSRDDNDICNLGSLNMARFESRGQWQEAIAEATKFLLAGTVYSLVPYPEVADTREKNRRLGLGLMGVHEWLLMRGKRYEPDEELGWWLQDYADITDQVAAETADEWGISRPVKTRAVAPAGSIAILGETTSGIEPVFCKAVKRRWYKDGKWHFQYVVDATAKRLTDHGIDPAKIEDAYELAQDVERRVAFQSFVQNYVDHGISSTINLPRWGTEHNNEATVKPIGRMLYDYLPSLRGITSYPDGSRGGQPLTPVDMDLAMDFEGVDYEEFGAESACVGGSCGI